MRPAAILGLLALLSAPAAAADPSPATVPAAGAAPIAIPEPGPLAPTPEERAQITVGSVINGTSGGLVVGPAEVLRAKAIDKLAADGLPAVAPLTQRGAEIDAGPARFVINGLVTGQACHRVSDWTGCRWRIRWEIYDRRGRTIVWRSSAVGEASVRQSTATSGMYHDVVLDSLGVLSGDEALVARIAEAEPDPVPRAPEWGHTLEVRLCEGAPHDIAVLRGAFAQVGGGTATIISPDGFALTSARLTDGEESVAVTLASGELTTAPVLRVDEISDVAVLAIPGEDWPCIPPSQRAPAVGDAAISVVATEGGIATAAGGFTATRGASGLQVLDATAADFAIGLGGAVLDEQSHLLGLRVQPLEAPDVAVLPAQVVPTQLGIRAAPSSTADLGTIERTPANGPQALGPLETSEPPLAPPRPPARTSVTMNEIPGAIEMTAGGVMLAGGGAVAVVSGILWVEEESNAWSFSPNRATYATATLTGAAVAIGGAALLGVGYRKQQNAQRAELTAGPNHIGVRGRF